MKILNIHQAIRAFNSSKIDSKAFITYIQSTDDLSLAVRTTTHTLEWTDSIDFNKILAYCDHNKFLYYSEYQPHNFTAIMENIPTELAASWVTKGYFNEALNRDIKIMANALAALPQCAEFLLSFPSIKEWIGYPSCFTSLLLAAPKLTESLFAIFETVDINNFSMRLWSLTDLIKAAPQYAEHLLYTKALVNGIQDGVTLVKIMNTAPELKDRLLSDSRLNHLLRSSDVVKLILAAPQLAEYLLYTQGLDCQILDEKQIRELIDVAPKLADRLIAEYQHLISNVDIIATTVKHLSPATALSFVQNRLAIPKIQDWMRRWDGQFSKILKTVPAATAEKLIDTLDLHKLIFSSESLGDAIKAVPQRAEDLLKRFPQHITNGYAVASAIHALPQQAQSLIETHSDKIADFTQLKHVIHAAPQCIKSLLADPRLSGLICNGRLATTIIAMAPQYAEYLLIHLNWKDLIRSGEDAVYIISKMTPEAAQHYLNDLKWKDLITRELEVKKIIEDAPWLARLVVEDPRLRNLLCTPQIICSMVCTVPNSAVILFTNPALRAVFTNPALPATFFAKSPLHTVPKEYYFLQIIKAAPECFHLFLNEDPENTTKLMRVFTDDDLIRRVLLACAQNGGHNLLGIFEDFSYMFPGGAFDPSLEAEIQRICNIQSAAPAEAATQSTLSLWLAPPSRPPAAPSAAESTLDSDM